MRSFFQAMILIAAALFPLTSALAQQEAPQVNKEATPQPLKETSTIEMPKEDTEKMQKEQEETVAVLGAPAHDLQKSAYALGVSVGLYVEKALKEQHDIGIELNTSQLLTGIKDTLDGKNVLSDDELKSTLSSFDRYMWETAANQNAVKGKVYRDAFEKENGVQKTPSGLLYLIEKEGEGKSPADNDIITVNYTGTFVNGDVFDSTDGGRGPASFPLSEMIVGWKEGLKHVKTGGKIKLVVPPELAYGKSSMSSMPPNSTLIFQVELLGVEQPQNNLNENVENKTDENTAESKVNTDTQLKDKASGHKPKENKKP